MYGGPAIPPGARPVERAEEARLYPVVTIVAGIVFVLLLIGLVILLRWSTGAEETAALRLVSAG
jgi:hypothetical protein